jgi:hypothetical protein
MLKSADMRKIFRPFLLLLAILVLLTGSAFSYISYKHSEEFCLKLSEPCSYDTENGLLWDIFPSQIFLAP